MTKTIRTIGRGAVSRARALPISRAGVAGAVLVALGLAGCQSSGYSTYGVPFDRVDRHPIAVTEASETLDIPVGVHSGGLEPATRAMVRAFGASFVAHRGTVLQVLVPSRTANESAARHVSRHVMRELKHAGVPAAAIERRAYRVQEMGATPPVRLAYPRIKAVANKCGAWPRNLAHNPENRQFFDFGCATQYNLASIIAAPTDLLGPRGTAPADMARRSVVIDKLRAGEGPAGIYPSIDDKGQASEDQ